MATTENGETRVEPANEGMPDRLAAAVGDENPPRLPFPVVAIGGSAGGLEAFIEFFKAMPADAGMAYVVVQHLPPEHESLIPEILGRHTRMPVHAIEDGMRLEANHVYPIRPGHTLLVKHGRLHLTESTAKRGHGRPVDDLFRSLAEEQRERAICIVMSGMGSNGSAGAAEVRAVGGLTIAQEPESAKFPSMPQHLIAANLADLILRPQEMPAALLKYAHHPYVRGESSQTSEKKVQKAIGEILTILRTRARHDFTGYKTGTILRRIQRRMGLTQIEAIPTYAALLRQSPTEISSLVDDLLIHVTGFFRDPDAWDALRERVIVPMIREKEQQAAVRCWVSACATGEEAYTLAMLLHEVAEEEGKILNMKIFATDMAERTLAHARAGIYPGGIEAEITPERLNRFFDPDGSVYRIKPELRETVVFAPQNVIHDPPFSKLDICCCRNLLIYLDGELQERVLTLLHFGLLDSGALFLGSSETVPPDLFEPIDKRYRIYRRIGPTRHARIDFPKSNLDRIGDVEGGSAKSPQQRPSLAQVANLALLERHTPAAVIVDRYLRVVYVHGKTDDFLSVPAGEPTRDLQDLVKESIRGAVRSAIQRVTAESQPKTVQDGLIQTAEGEFRIQVTAELLDDRRAAGHYLICFEKRKEMSPSEPLPAPSGDHSEGMSLELDRVREELQSTVEELQSSNEELRAANEETMSVNEELQSSNEELETSKEELQSLNEELKTVNAQLEAKADELEATTNDLRSLLASTNIAVVFLDTQFRIRQFTPAIRELIDVISSDIGRPLKDLAKKFQDVTLMADCQKVLETLVPLDSEIVSENGQHFVRRVHPYRTTDNRITGVVVTFVNSTRHKSVENALRMTEEQLRLVVEGADEYAMILLDPHGTITAWNVGAERITGYDSEEAIGRSGAILLPEPTGDAFWATEMEVARETGRFAEDGRHVRKDGTEFWGSGVLHAVRDGQGEMIGYVKILRDASERRNALEKDGASPTLTSLEADWEAGMRDRFLAVLSHELRTPLSSILLWTQILKQEPLADHQVQAVNAIEISADSQQQLLNELLDTSRIASGKIQLDPQPTDLVQLIRSTVETFQPSAQAESISIELELPERLSPSMMDAGRIRQVLGNLLTNAIKFNSPGGKVTVRLSSTPRSFNFRSRTRGVESERSSSPASSTHSRSRT
jgi:two-component system CheB/CheR fusion protein